MSSPPIPIVIVSGEELPQVSLAAQSVRTAKARLLTTQQRRRASSHFRNKKKRFAVKCKAMSASFHSNSLNLSHASRSSSVSRLRLELRALRQQNKALAIALNSKLTEHALVVDRCHELQREKLEADMVLAGERIELEEERTKAVVSYAERVRAPVNDLLQHLSSMSGSVGSLLTLAQEPARRSRSAGVRNTTSSGFSLGAFPIRRAPSVPKPSTSRPNKASIAHVSPRVNGHAIHKPQIEIARLGADDIIRYQEEMRRRRMQQEQQDDEEEEEDGDSEMQEEEEEGGDHQEDEEEEEPLQQTTETRAPRSRLASAHNMSVIDEGEEVPASRRNSISSSASPALAAASSPTRRRRPRTKRRTASFQNSPFVLLQDAAELLAQYNLQPTGEEAEERATDEGDTEGEDAGPGETVVLMPRLVLERVKVTSTTPDKKGKGKGKGKRSVVRPSAVSRLSEIVEPPQAMSSSPIRHPVPSTSTGLGANEETPRGRESAGELARRYCNGGNDGDSEEEDPLEGPSWLFGPDEESEDMIAANVTKTEKRALEKKRKSSSSRLKASLGGCSKKLDLCQESESDALDEEEEAAAAPVAATAKSKGRKTVTWKQSLEARKKKSAAKSSSKKSTAVVASAEEPAVVVPAPPEEEEVPEPVEESRAPAVSTSPPTAPSDPASVPDQSEPTTGRPRRRAAAAASGNLAEPSLGKKMRQGDPMASSVYKDFVPQTNKKRKSSVKATEGPPPENGEGPAPEKKKKKKK